MLSKRIKMLEKRLDEYYLQHKKLKKKVNWLEKYIEKYMDWLKNNVDELFVIEYCNCNKESINSLFEFSTSKLKKKVKKLKRTIDWIRNYIKE